MNKIVIYSKTHGVKTVLIDPEDYDLVSSFTWHLSRCTYKLYAAKGSYPRTHMQRIILGLKEGDKTIVDHINGDSLDNRKSNLRLVTPRGNIMNSDRSRNAKMIHKRFNRFRIYTSINGKRFLVSCATLEEAEEALRKYRDAV